MKASGAIGIEARGPVLGSLEAVCLERGADVLQRRIAELRAFVENDLADVETDLADISDDRGDAPSSPHATTPMHASVKHLLGQGGKRLRPLCVALASRVGEGFTPAARDLAVAAELVHNATLLHDDVVDIGEKRRGAAAARVIYGNAASIFAGDWLLVEALMRVRRARLSDVLDRALGVLAQMLEAEALQLARRGRMSVTTADYMQVVEGKTASLFRWALFAGGRAGGLDGASCDALERFGGKLGVAFQIIDDVLDFDGDPTAIGKDLFADLREGKATYPLLLALEREPSLRGALESSLALDAATIDPETAQRAAIATRETGALEDARAFAQRLLIEATDALAELPARPATRALARVAESIATRRN